MVDNNKKKKITDKDLAIATVSENGFELKNVSEELLADKDVVLCAVKNNGMVIKYATQNLRADKEIALAALEDCHFAYDYIDNFLKLDKDIIYYYITKCKDIKPEMINAECFKDKEFILRILEYYINNNGSSFFNSWVCVVLASDDLLIDTDIIDKVKMITEGFDCDFSSMDLKVIIEEAIVKIDEIFNTTHWISSINNAAKKDLLSFVRLYKNGCLPEWLQSKDVLAVICSLWPEFLVDNDQFSNDRDFAMKLSKMRCPESFEYFSESIRNDKEVVMAYLESMPKRSNDIIPYIGPDVDWKEFNTLTEKKRREIIDDITRRGGFFDLEDYCYGHNRDYIEAVLGDEEIALANVNGNRESLKYLPHNQNGQPSIELRLKKNGKLDQKFNRQSVSNYLDNPTDDFKFEVSCNGKIVDSRDEYTGTPDIFIFKCILLDIMTPSTAVYDMYVKKNKNEKEAQVEAFLLILEEFFNNKEECERIKYTALCRNLNTDLADFKCFIPTSFLIKHYPETKECPECFYGTDPLEFMNERQFARWVLPSYYLNFCTWDRVKLRCTPKLREDARKNGIKDLAILYGWD